MIRVRAIAPGFYGMIRRPGEKTREGVRLDEFDIADESEFGTWMERVEPPPPAKAEAIPLPATATASSTTVSVESLMGFYADIRPDLALDELTATGLPKKAALEKRLGAEVSKSVFFNFTRVAAEQRRAAN